MKMVERALLLLVLVIAGAFLGWMGREAVGLPAPEPKVIERHFHTTDNITTYGVQAVYIDRPVIVTEVEKVYVERPFYLPSPNNRNFTSLAELVQWLHSDNTSEMEYTGVNPLAIDCDNFAIILQANADCSGGYFMNFQTNGFLEHAYNTTIIDGVLYGIEPQTDRVWRMTPLD